MKLSDLIYEGEYICSSVECDIEIKHLTRSENEIYDGSLFFVLNPSKLANFRNCNMLPCVLVSEFEIDGAENIPTVIVENVRRAYSLSYSRFYDIDYRKLRFIGITGTNGKTSTASFIKAILSDSGFKVGFIGTGKIEIGNTVFTDKCYSMTTPDPELLYKAIKKMELAHCDYVVMEVSSHSLSLEKLFPIKFDYAAFLNLSPEHLDFHSDMESYFNAKLSLFDSAKVGVFNIDDLYSTRASEIFKQRKICIGALYRGDSYATDITDMGFDGISYLYHGKDFIFRMQLNMPGIYNVYNSLVAAAICIDIGISPCKVKKILKDIDGIPGRYEIIRDDITVVIDYAHTAEAFREILKNIKKAINPKNRLTVIFGCGGERDKGKRPKMAEIAESYADRVIVTQDNSRQEEPMDIIADIIHGFSFSSFEVCEDRREAIRRAILSSESGDTVAIIGKGAEKYNIDKFGYHEFDEYKIIKEALFERAENRKNANKA